MLCAGKIPCVFRIFAGKSGEIGFSPAAIHNPAGPAKKFLFW